MQLGKPDTANGLNDWVLIMKSKTLSKRRRSQLRFYFLVIALPMVQFVIFYIGVNFNSILLAFKGYDINKGYYFIGFDNFKQVFHDLKNVPYLFSSIKNSLVLYFVNLLAMALSLLFSFYIYKRRTLGTFFKIILFLPNIISVLILAVMYKYFTERAVPELATFFHKTIGGLLSDDKTAFPTILIFNVLISFGTQTLLASSAMEGISNSVTDASKIDGCTPLQEYIYITIPMIWPTIKTFLVVGVAGIFTNQMCLFSFFGNNASYSLYTFGYFLYTSIQQASFSDYPYLAAMGLVLTAVAVPLTYLVKLVVDKLGPKVA